SEKKNGSSSSSGWGFVNLDLVSASNFKDNMSNPNTGGKMVSEKNDSKKGMQENHLVVGGIKRGHTSKNLESDQDSVSENVMAVENSSELALVIVSDLRN
ncbi:hypothetical protein KI387_023027, partial [Taxus chinensis]